MKFRTKRGEQAYEELMIIAMTNKQEIVAQMQAMINDGVDAATIASTGLNNAKVYHESASHAISVACQIDREEYALDCALKEQYESDVQSCDSENLN